MALKTLEGIKEINGKKIITDEQVPVDIHGEVDWKKFDELREEYPISVNNKIDMISFKMLTRPASAGGNMSLCQFTELIGTSLAMLKSLNNDFPCRENSITITKLEEALMWQQKRTEDRIKRNVEGRYEH